MQFNPQWQRAMQRRSAARSRQAAEKRQAKQRMVAARRGDVVGPRAAAAAAAAAAAEEGKEDRGGERRKAASGAAAASTAAAALITVDTALRASGEDALGWVRELVLRGAQPPVAGFEPDCAASLAASLELLSLSRNAVRSLASFMPLQALVELNLNFNAIGPALLPPPTTATTTAAAAAAATTRAATALPNLRKLYLSNNRLQTLAGLADLSPRLETVCLFKNKLLHLEEALGALRQLPRLRALDLGGNPCSLGMCDYKHTVVLRLRKLDSLDGDPVQALDRQLAEMHFQQQQQARARGLQAAKARRAGRGRSRPSTAPVGGRKPLGPGFGAGAATDATAAASATAAGGGPSSPARLFRSEFLNNHPVMLQYVAEGLVGSAESAALSAELAASGRATAMLGSLVEAVAEEEEEEEEEAEEEEGEDNDDGDGEGKGEHGSGGSKGGGAPAGASSRRSFVERLRRATATVARADDEGKAGGTNEEDQRHKTKRRHASKKRPRNQTAAPFKSASLADPHAVIRRLVLVNEELRNQLEIARRRQAEGRVYVGSGADPAAGKTTPRTTTTPRKEGAGKEEEEEEEEEEERGEPDEFAVDIAALRDEVDMLRVENRNMYAMRQENESLRQAASLREKQRQAGAATPANRHRPVSMSQAASHRTGSGADVAAPSTASHRLWDENTALKRELASAKQLIARLHAALAKAEAAAAAAAATKTAKGGQDGAVAADIAADIAGVIGSSGLSEADYLDAEDAEIAALIERNASNLRDMRRDLKEAEREMSSFGGWGGGAGASPGDVFAAATSSASRGVGAAGRSGAAAAAARPQTAGPRMRPAFDASAAMASRGSASRRQADNSSTVMRADGSNLIGRHLATADDVNDAKAAIRRAQLEMQRLRGARAALEAEEEDDDEEQAGGKSAGAPSPPTTASPEAQHPRERRVREARSPSTKQRMAQRLAGVPELSSPGTAFSFKEGDKETGVSPLASRRSDTEESRTTAEAEQQQRERILFFNDGEPCN